MRNVLNLLQETRIGAIVLAFTTRLRDTWQRDILLRLAVSIFLAVALSTAAYTTYAVRTLRAEAEQNLQQRSERIATMLAQALARPLFDINNAAITSVVDAMRGTPEVLMLRVLAPGGAEMASFTVPRIDPKMAIVVHREISFQDGSRNYVVGAIDLAYSRSEVDEETRRRLLHALAVNLLLALTIVGSIFLVGRKAVRPFADIQRSLEKLTQGKTDIELSGIGRADQVGRLSGAVRSFRDTLTRLRDAESELRELNGDLEQKIDARTHELKLTMQVARDSQRKVQSIVDTALDAVVGMDRNGRVVGWNRQAETIFGYSREEALGQQLEPLIIPQRYRYDHRKGMQRYVAGGGGGGEVLDRRIEVEALRADGSEFPIELSITKVVLDGEDNYEFCAFIRDISDRREREQKLVTANVMAEAANIAKSEFLANMSHEIRTPMSAIIGMAYLALRTELSPKQHDYVSKIHRAALALLGIINDILDFSKIEAGRLEVEEIPFFLDDVLANVASVTSQRAADKQLEYLFNVPSSIPRHLCGDPLRLGQVLINLVNNAVKFTASGELELAVSLLEQPAGGKVALRFAIRDTGIGMSPQQKTKLFRAFSQANGSTTRQYGGTGLGLSISQQLVRLMGGAIQVDSEENKGSTFYFDLQFQLSGQPERVALVPAELNGARVLLVDDSPVALEVLSEAVRALPLRADTATDGVAALAAVRAADAEGDPYKLVFTDWRMPKMDGVELARQVREDAKLRQTPGMVLVTAFGREEVQREADAAGFVGFLFKPIGQSALVDTLVSMFASSNPVTEPRITVPGQQFTSRVLLVEDNAVNQQIAAELMAVQGIQVDFAGNGREALELLQREGPQAFDLVLMDLEMPEMDGHEATRELRKDARFAELPVVAMTAHALADIRERCLKEGMQDYITKPIDPEQLYATMSRWLGKALLPAPPVQPRNGNGNGHGAMPAFNGIDTARGLRHVAGNSQLYMQLLDRFRHSQRETAADLRSELAEGNMAAAGKRVHTLRGVAGNIGATSAEAAAQTLESALAGGDPVTGAMITTLESALADTIGALDSHFANAPAQAASDTAVRPDAALAELTRLLAGFSGESTDYFDSVRSALATLLPAATLDRLAHHMAHYEFEAAHRLLRSAAQET